MRTNRKQVRDAIKLHILECVYDSGENNFVTLECAASYLNDEFNRVANYPNNLQKFPNSQERFMDYMLGIPFHFFYNHFDINNYLESIGLINDKKYTDEKSEKLYYYLIYSEMMKAVNKSK